MIGQNGLPNDADGLRRLKAMGFSDKRLATLAVRSVGVAGGLAETQARALGPAARRAAWRWPARPARTRCASCASKLGVLPVLQADRQLRRRVRGDHAVHVLDLRGAELRRGRERGRSDRPPQDRHPRRRAEPDRAGHRVRLLLRPRLLRAQRGRVRDDHDQLQPGDGLDRLRHLGPALFRAADRRGRARDPARRAFAGASWSG